MFDGLIGFGHALLGFLTPARSLYALIASLRRLRDRRIARPDRDHGRRADDDAHDQAAARQRLLILICTYVGAIYGGSRSAILLNIPGTPAYAAVLSRRPCACPPGTGRARHGHCDLRLGARHWIGMVCACLLHADARRNGAEVRRLRILLARAVRRRDFRQSHRKRSAQGLDGGLARPVHRRHRPGGHLCLRPLHVRHARSRRAAFRSCRRWSAPSASPKCSP